MKFKTSVIDLDSIQVQKDYPDFDPDKILYLANSTVQLGGLLRNPVVRQIDVENYELVSGFLEYKAYLKAREINPELLDRLTVFIMEPKNEEAVIKQLEAYEKIEKVTGSSKDNHSTDNSIVLDNLVFEFKNFKQEIHSKLEAVRNETLKAIESKLPTPLKPLEAFNKIDDPRAAAMVTKNLAGLPMGKRIIERLRELKAENPTLEFKTFDEVITTLGKYTTKKSAKNYISKEKMFDIIDKWN